MSLLFIILLLSGLLLYVTGKYIASAFIFFFFLLKGFQIIPESYFVLKPIDYAVVYIFALFIWGCIKYDNFIPKNRITLFISIYLTFILFEMSLSHFYYHIPWSEIIRTGRQHLFVLSYFIFRRLNKSEIDYLIKLLFYVVLIQCCLFIIQVPTGLPMLTGYEGNFKYGYIYRCYNIPILLCFYVFYGVFCNPFKNPKLVITSIILLTATVFLPLHRSWSIIFIAILIFGFLLKFGMLKSLRNILITGGIAIMLLSVCSVYISSRTMNDIYKVSKGEYMDTEDIELDQESTLLFRFAHFYERFIETTETSIGSVFGVGFMSEGSKYTYNNFNFIVGLSDEKTNEIVQLDTSDIAWSLLILRYGIVGSIIFLSFYVYFIVFYGRRYNNPMALSIMLYLIFIIGLSITSDQLYYVSFFVFPLMYNDILYEKS